VLNVFKKTTSHYKPGVSIKEVALITRELMAKELLDLKLVDKEDVKEIEPKSPNFKKYYPHDVSHYLGLDVHDVGSYSQPLKPGMVITCEPGIYIRQESLGIRIENDLLITEGGNTDLMEGIPFEIEEIEEKMNKKRNLS
jgi:Xaa-Pro aminopeptidase